MNIFSPFTSVTKSRRSAHRHFADAADITLPIIAVSHFQHQPADPDPHHAGISGATLRQRLMFRRHYADAISCLRLRRYFRRYAMRPIISAAAFAGSREILPFCCRHAGCRRFRRLTRYEFFVAFAAATPPPRFIFTL